MTKTLDDVVSAPVEAALFSKIAETMAEVGRVQKRGRNEFHKYDYATEADILEAVRGKLAERHVAVIPSLVSITERPYETDRGKASVVTTARIAFTFVDGETGAMFKAEWAGQGDDPADKGLYKAYTGALKYFMTKTFLIPTGDDPEADPRTDERAGNRRHYGKSQTQPTVVAASGSVFPDELRPVVDAAKQMLADKRWTMDDLKAHLIAGGAKNTNSIHSAIASMTSEQSEELYAEMTKLLNGAKT